MFEDLRLRVREKRNDRLYKPAIRKLEKEGQAEQAESLIGEYLHFRDEIADERRALSQAKLMQKARRLCVPVLRYTRENANLWEESSASYGRLLLTDKGMRLLLDDIRKEQTARRDRRLGWLAPLTGLITALTALAAVLLNFLRSK